MHSRVQKFASSYRRDDKQTPSRFKLQGFGSVPEITTVVTEPAGEKRGVAVMLTSRVVVPESIRVEDGPSIVLVPVPVPTVRGTVVSLLPSMVNLTIEGEKEVSEALRDAVAEKLAIVVPEPMIPVPVPDTAPTEQPPVAEPRGIEHSMIPVLGRLEGSTLVGVAVRVEMTVSDPTGVDGSVVSVLNDVYGSEMVMVTVVAELLGTATPELVEASVADLGDVSEFSGVDVMITEPLGMVGMMGAETEDGTLKELSEVGGSTDVSEITGVEGKMGRDHEEW